MMVDFLKSNPYVTMDDYLWRLNPCLIRLMSMDNTRVHYLSEKQAKKKGGKMYDGSDLGALKNDLGVVVFDGK